MEWYIWLGGLVIVSLSGFFGGFIAQTILGNLKLSHIESEVRSIRNKQNAGDTNENKANKAARMKAIGAQIKQIIGDRPIQEVIQDGKSQGQFLDIVFQNPDIAGDIMKIIEKLQGVMGETEAEVL